MPFAFEWARHFTHGHGAFGFRFLAHPNFWSWFRIINWFNRGFIAIWGNNIGIGTGISGFIDSFIDEKMELICFAKSGFIDESLFPLTPLLFSRGFWSIGLFIGELLFSIDERLKVWSMEEEVERQFRGNWPYWRELEERGGGWTLIGGRESLGKSGRSFRSSSRKCSMWEVWWRILKFLLIQWQKMNKIFRK